MKFSILGFFWVGKFEKYFLACLHLGRDFLGIRNNDLKIAVVVPRAFALRVVLPDKVQQTCFAVV